MLGNFQLMIINILIFSSVFFVSCTTRDLIISAEDSNSPINKHGITLLLDKVKEIDANNSIVNISVVKCSPKDLMTNLLLGDNVRNLF